MEYKIFEIPINTRKEELKQLVKGELKFELKENRSGIPLAFASKYGEFIFHIDERGIMEAYLWITHLDLEDEEENSVSELEWKIFLDNFDNSTSEELSDLPNLEYTLVQVKEEKPEGEPYYLFKKTYKNCVIDSEEEKKKILELLKMAPFVFLKEGNQKWIKKFRNILTKGRITDKYTYYVLNTGNGLVVQVEPERIEARKIIFNEEKGRHEEEKILNKKDPQKAKELAELFEKVLSKQSNLQDAISETLKSLGLTPGAPKRTP